MYKSLIKEDNFLKNQQLNEKYLLNKKHEEDNVVRVLVKAVNLVKARVDIYDRMGEHSASHSQTNLQYALSEALEERLEEYLNYRIKTVDPLYFTFGKYNGRIVQDVLNQDKDYCKWFSINVIGKDFNTLKILDYLHKTLHNQDYIDKNKNEELQKILQAYIPSEWHKDIDKEVILGTKRSSTCNFDVGLTPWEEEMMEVYDYGDLC